MSLLFIDGLDYYRDLDTLAYHWHSATDELGSPGVVRWRSSDGRFGGGCVQLVAGALFGFIQRVVPAKSTLVVGFAFYVGQSDGGQFFKLGYAGQTQFRLVLNNDLTIDVMEGDTATEIGSTAGAGLALNEQRWFYIEVKAVCGSSGSVEIHVNEEDWGTFTGNTDPVGSGSFGDVKFEDGAGSSGASEENNGYLVDDVYVLDTAGAKNNDFLGDVRIETLQPAADTVQADFTPLAGGDNYLEIDDPEIDDDGSYNASSTVGHRDEFSMENLGTTPEEIFAIQHKMAARKSEAGTRGIKAVLNIGGTLYRGAEHLLNEDYLYEPTIWEDNPDTGAAWTQSEIEAMNVGYEVSS